MTFERERDSILNGMCFTPKGAFIAGGAITSTFTNKPIADYDLYFKSRDAFVRAVEEAYEEGLWCVCCSGRAITFVKGSDVYQLMHFRFFPAAADIFGTFDFTCCMAAIDMDSKEFAFSEHFVSDTSRRELVFNHGTAFPIASAMRVLKYQEKGYTIKRAEMLKIAVACSFRPCAGWDELAQQIGGQYGQAASVDKSKPFCLEEAARALGAAEIAPASAQDAPATAEDALGRIFGAVAA